MLETSPAKKASRLYAPPGKLQMAYFIDDLNMPMLDQYKTQSAIELKLAKQDYNHWWDRGKITIKDIGNTQYMTRMNPTAGSFIVNPRMQHFWTGAVSFPEPTTLRTICQTFRNGSTHYNQLDRTKGNGRIAGP